MDSVLNLKAEGGSLRLTPHRRPAWFAVELVREGITTSLGAEAGGVLRDRLFGAVGRTSDPEAPSWVLSLSEGHHALHRRRIGDRLELLVEDPEGRDVGALRLDNASRSRWAEALLRWHAPTRVTLDPAVHQALPRAPAHLVHALRQQVEAAVSEPDVVFHGLREESDRLRGYAWCKRFPVFHGNDGRTHPVSGAGMPLVFCAHCDDDGVLFDWGWVRASERDPSRPVNWRRRFACEVGEHGAPSLDLHVVEGPGAFRGPTGWYSPAGDCLTFHFSPSPSFQERENDDLTLFLSWPFREPTGVKVKNVSRHLADLRSGEQVSLSSPHALLSLQFFDESSVPGSYGSPFLVSELIEAVNSRFVTRSFLGPRGHEFRLGDHPVPIADISLHLAPRPQAPDHPHA